MKLKLLLPLAITIVIAGCANRLLKEAKTHSSNYEYDAAARIYETYLETNPDQEVMLELADCYRLMNRDSAAVHWYARGITSPHATQEDRIHYACVLHSSGKHEEARVIYADHLASNPDDKFVHTHMRSCDSAAKFLKDNIYYEANEMDFGFEGSVFSPVQFGNDLLITAEAATTSENKRSSWTGRGYLNVYVVSDYLNFIVSSGHGEYTKQQETVMPLSGSVNSGLHEGPVAVSMERKTLYFTRSGKQDGETNMARNRDNHLELCSAELVDNLWTNVKSLPFNSEDYSTGHPAITANGSRLFFISNKPDGFGGTDIYYSDNVNGVWTSPVNAGDQINTSGDEMFPTISQLPGTDEVLYFSSNGHAGAGGLDIYKCATGGSTLCTPVRLPVPFNSTSDDFGLMFLQNGKEGYFSSDRNNAHGIDKIFHFRRLEPTFVVNFSVIDKETKMPVPNTEVDILSGKDNSTTKYYTDNNGRVIFSADSLTAYGFTLRCTEYFCGYSSVSTGRFDGRLNDTTFLVVPIEKIVINKVIRLENIYYDFDKWNIRADAAPELDKVVKLLIDNPTIKIELSSHTDSRGGDKYNMNLSQKRAQSAVDYIVSKGISKDRIYAKGYGENVPLNKCTNGKKCTEEEFQFNRRTEFKVVEVAK
jgi:peptidoglycan-associated lipoprotein